MVMYGEIKLTKLANTLLKGKRRDEREGKGNLAPTVISKSQPLCIQV